MIFYRVKVISQLALVALVVGLSFNFANVQADQILYVANQGVFSQNITEYNSSGSLIGTITTSVSDPLGLAVNSSGNLFVVNAGNSTIREYNVSGSLISTISASVNGPEGLAVNSSGDLYVANWNNSTITEYNASGSLIGTIFAGLNHPTGLALNSSGDLYVANLNNTITGYNPSGSLIGTISTSIDSPTFLAFGSSSAVPEPSSFVLLGIGALGCGGYGWRKKKSTG